MKTLLLAVAACALAAIAPAASAADWHNDDDDDVYESGVDEPRVIVRERIIIREYVTRPHRGRIAVEHEEDDDDDDVVVVRRSPRHHVDHRYIADDDWPGPRVLRRRPHLRVYHHD